MRRQLVHQRRILPQEISHVADLMTHGEVTVGGHIHRPIEQRRPRIQALNAQRRQLDKRRGDDQARQSDRDPAPFAAGCRASIDPPCPGGHARQQGGDRPDHLPAKGGPARPPPLFRPAHHRRNIRYQQRRIDGDHAADDQPAATRYHWRAARERLNWPPYAIRPACCKVKRLLPQMIGYIDNHSLIAAIAPIIQQRRFDQRRRLVVQQAVPPPGRDKFRQHHGGL